MSDDPRINTMIPTAAELVCAVEDHDAVAVAQALCGLKRDQLYALALLLAANVADDSPLAERRLPIDASPAAIIADIQAATCAAFGITLHLMLSNSRQAEVGRARQVAMAACRLAGLSSVVIGQGFNRDHSTVLYAATRVGEDARLRRISNRLAAPHVGCPGLLGDELEDGAA